MKLVNPIVLSGCCQRALALMTILFYAAISYQLGAISPFDGAVDLGADEYNSPWFGQYNAVNYPWIFHREHGWLCAEEQEAGIWFWSPLIGWFWTEPTCYTNVFGESRGWLSYDGPDWNYFDYSTGEWVNPSQQTGGASYFPIPGPSETFLWRYTVNDGEDVFASDGTVSMTLRNFRIDVDFTGWDLKYENVLSSDISGTGLTQGQEVPFTGAFQFVNECAYRTDALGVYIQSSVMEMSMSMLVMQQSFTSVETTSNDFESEFVVRILSRNDLYSYPVGTRFEQILGSVNQDISELEYQNNILTASNSNSATVTLNYTLEIVGKFPVYSVGGHTYYNVIKFKARDNINGDVGNIDFFSTQDIWVAPGIGIIETIEFSPLYDEPMHLVLTDCNLW